MKFRADLENVLTNHSLPLCYRTRWSASLVHGLLQEDGQVSLLVDNRVEEQVVVAVVVVVVVFSHSFL